MDRDIPIYDTGHYGDVEFHLRYITNANDTKMVNHIEFPEAPDLRGWASETGGSFFDFFNNRGKMPGRQVGTYSIRTVYVKMDAHEIPVSEDEIRLTKAKVHFSNGEIIDADLGEIVLYGYGSNSGHFHFMSGSSSSDGSSSTRMQVLKNVTLIKLESPQLDRIKNLVELKIDGTNYNEIAGMKYKIGDYISINSIFNEPEDTTLKFNDYNIHPKLYFEDNEGNTFTYRFYNVDYRQHNFEFMDIIKYLRARGEL